MPSPFPGMDPYLEDPAFWPDFHQSFITYWRDALTDQLPDSYEARIDERVRLVEISGDLARDALPDVAITQHSPSAPRPNGSAGTLILEPAIIPLPIEVEVHESRIEILHRPNRTLVTVLELLSPADKMLPGREDYRNKRMAVIAQRVHLVELDLLVAGQRLSMRRPLPPGDYYALVSRSDRRPNSEVYAWTVRDPLPTIPIPLKAPDPDVSLDLAAVFRTAYEKGRYRRWLPYDKPPSAPLAPEDARWATELAAACRSGS